MGAPASPPPAIFWHLQSRPIPGSMKIEQKYVPFQTPIMKTPYMVMTLQANEAPAKDNILAGLFLGSRLRDMLFSLAPSLPSKN